MDHISEAVLNDYRQRRLAPPQLLALDEHIAKCEECVQLLSESRPDLDQSIASVYSEIVSPDAAVDDHLSYEQLEALVDEEATDVDREIADVHLQSCSECANELSGLGELRDQPPQVVIPISQPKGSWLTWPRLALAALSVLVIASIGWFIWRSQKNESPVVTASATPSPVNIASPPVPTSSQPLPIELVASLDDGGGKVTLDGTGKIEGLPELSPALNASVKNALTTGQLSISPAFAELRTRGGTLMGGSQDGIPFQLLSPVGVVVKTDRPALRWKALPGATTYIVKVFDSNFNELTNSLSQTATSWTVPLPLPRGGTYSWQVTAVRNGEEITSPVAPAPQARFRVLAHDRVIELKRVETVKPVSHLALGTAYAEAGLLEDARREFRLLLKANPDSKVAQKLVQEVSRK